ncbi:hypothetical protein GCM10011498_00200 [Amylibacter cionae]|uniref:Uncharacterized protein n=1 Tax=Neptunicoccus cionae TaxID=2035344 RepID=A0A916QRQ4_9RHOB|nr:hypothetical protein GCM10011498_00200 [Amylibacter cionae]
MGTCKYNEEFNQDAVHQADSGNALRPPPKAVTRASYRLLRLLSKSALLAEFPAIEPLINSRVSLGTAKPTECDRRDPEKRCYQIMAK